MNQRYKTEIQAYDVIIKVQQEHRQKILYGGDEKQKAAVEEYFAVNLA